jgi:benzoate 4-monooxygenase
MAYTTIILIALLPLACYLIPYLSDPLKLRRFPAPFPAAFTAFWLFVQSRKGRRHFAVDDAHKRLGKFVRIQPDHVSIADLEALGVVYGHGTGFLKRYSLAPASIQVSQLIAM